MAKRKRTKTTDKSGKKKANEVNEPATAYGKGKLQFFGSFEEMNEADRKEMASLSPLECLQRLRQLINLAYGMHGYDPNDLPKKHSIKIIPYKPK